MFVAFKNLMLLFSPIENLQGYFEKFGEITDCVIMTDPVTKRPRLATS